MATPTLWQLMEAVSTQVKTAAGLRSEAEITGSVQPPFLMVGVPPLGSYRATFNRGVVEIQDWPLYVLTSAKVDRVGQRALAEYASWTGPKSVPLALEADKTLGGIADDLAVTSFRPLGIEEVGIVGYFGGEFRLSVLLPGI